MSRADQLLEGALLCLRPTIGRSQKDSEAIGRAVHYVESARTESTGETRKLRADLEETRALLRRYEELYELPGSTEAA